MQIGLIWTNSSLEKKPLFAAVARRECGFVSSVLSTTTPHYLTLQTHSIAVFFRRTCRGWTQNWNISGSEWYQYYNQRQGRSDTSYAQLETPQESILVRGECNADEWRVGLWSIARYQGESCVDIAAWKEGRSFGYQDSIHWSHWYGMFLCSSMNHGIKDIFS